jgi:hypothetical protein
MAKISDEDYKERLSKLVTQAILDAGRIGSSADTHIDINLTVDALCDSAASLIAAVAMSIEDREAGVAMIEQTQERLVSRLRFVVERMTDGTCPPPPRPRPALKIVD